jgi:tetratricopeptide (TPR) repeat protein
MKSALTSGVRGGASRLTVCIAMALVAGCGSDQSDPEARPVPGRATNVAATNTLPHEAATTLLLRLEQLRNQGQIADALSLAEAQRKQYPGTRKLNFAIGVLHGSRDDLHAAGAAFESELAIDPGHVESVIGLASVHTKLGQPQAALKVLDPLLQMQPDHSTATFLRARALAALQRLDEALPVLTSLAKRTDDPEHWSELGLIRRRAADLSGAEDAFRQALRRQPRHLGALLNLGQLLVRDGRREEGAELLERHRKQSLLHDRLDHLQRSARLAGATAANFAALADAHLEMGMPDAALQNYQRAIELDRDFPPATIGLAALMLDQGRQEEAMRWSVIAVMAAPNSMHAHYVLGMARLVKGDQAAAEQAFVDSRELGTWGNDAHLRVVEASLRVGALELASKELDLARENDPADSRLPGLRERLAQARRSKADQPAD